MNIFRDLLLTIVSKHSFSVAWQRARCQSAGHKLEGATPIDKLQSYLHPHNTDEFIYTVGIWRCSCGCIFMDAGLAFRNPLVASTIIRERFKP